MIDRVPGPYTLTYAPMPHHRAGLTYTASGYGKKIPTPYTLTDARGRRRRIYAICFSNSSTCYIETRAGGTRRIALLDHSALNLAVEQMPREDR